MECDASTVIIATCSVGPYWILDSLFLVAWLKEGYNELKLVKMAAMACGWQIKRAIGIQLGRCFNAKGSHGSCWQSMIDDDTVVV